MTLVLVRHGRAGRARLGIDLKLRKGAVWPFRETLEDPEVLV